MFSSDGAPLQEAILKSRTVRRTGILYQSRVDKHSEEHRAYVFPMERTKVWLVYYLQ